MPGPARFFGAHLAAAVERGEVDPAAVTAAARRLLAVFERLGALTDPAEIVERHEDRPEHRAVAREAAAASMVLLRNDGGVLPLDAGALRSLAVIGPNAARAQLMGGGSAKLRPYYVVSPLEALRERLGDGVEIRHERGVSIDRSAPDLAVPFAYEVFAGTAFEGEPVRRAERQDGNLMFWRSPVGEPGPFSVRGAGRFTPSEDGVHTFSVVVAGSARLRVGGEVVIDATDGPYPPGDQFFGMVSEEMRAEVELRAGEPVAVEAEWWSTDGLRDFIGVKVGCSLPTPPDLLDRAAAAAAACDAAVVIVGTNDDWETEGRDRASMDLPGEQDALVAAVLEANPRTVVVVNAGAPVTLPWAGRAPAILDAWFGGQEMAGALADVLLGDAEPSGRLPTTFPIAIEHTPAYGNFPGENGECRYGEGVLMGYRWYDARRLATSFPFGHGGSYTTFTIGEPRVSGDGPPFAVEVDVTNTGARRGAEVVQVYVAPVAPRLVRPPKELKAFAKLSLDPGETGTARLELDERAFAYWDPGDPDWPELGRRLAGSPFQMPGEERPAVGWRADPGEYEIRVGRSAEDILHAVTCKIGV